MDKRAEELKIAEIIIHTLLTMVIAFLTFVVALSNTYVYARFPYTAFVIPFAIIIIVAIAVYVLFDLVWKK